MRINDFVAGLLLAAFALAVLLYSRTFPNNTGQIIGPAAFPGVLAVLLLICASILAARGWRTAHRPPPAAWAKWVRSPRHLAHFVVTFVCLGSYTLAFETLGFIVCGVAVLLALFLLLRVPSGRAVALAIGITLAMHVFFYYGLRVPLPWGVLEPLVFR